LEGSWLGAAEIRGCMAEDMGGDARWTTWEEEASGAWVRGSALLGGVDGRGGGALRRPSSNKSRRPVLPTGTGQHTEDGRLPA
jgi:hypothetical protein